MVRLSHLFLVLLLLLGCSSHQNQETGTKGPKLILQVTPRQGFSPLRVAFHATLEGVQENDQEYHCLREEWDFGDGSVSAEERNCETYTDQTKVLTEFFAEHIYDRKGDYSAHLKLGDKKIRSNSVTLIVIEDRPGF